MVQSAVRFLGHYEDIVTLPPAVGDSPPHPGLGCRGFTDAVLPTSSSLSLGMVVSPFGLGIIPTGSWTQES